MLLPGRNTDVAPSAPWGDTRGSASVQAQRRGGGARGSGGGTSVPGVVGVQPGGSLAGNDSSEASSTSSSVWTWRLGGAGFFFSGLGSGTGRPPTELRSPGSDRRATAELPAGEDEQSDERILGEHPEE